MGVAVGLVLIVVAAVYLGYPASGTTNSGSCQALTFAVFSASTYAGGVQVPANVTETTVTNYTTSLYPAGPPGKIVVSSTTSALPGFSGYGEFTRCAYLSSSSTSRLPAT